MPYPKPTSGPPAGVDPSLRACPKSVAFTWDAVSVGFSCSMSATTPAATGLAMDVPSMATWLPSTIRDESYLAVALRWLTIISPGAATSGLHRLLPP